MKISSLVVWMASAMGSAAEAAPMLIRKSDVESKEWTTLENGMEFHPHVSMNEATHRLLSNSAYEKQYFLDGTETYYDTASQAWRLLGFYIDCNSQAEEEAADNYGDYRDLEDAGDGYNDAVCTRYLLWAAYIDPLYKGGGLDEYQQYDVSTGRWSACDHKADRCAKMDCHESSTNYKLLGVFKEANVENWLEQLVPHQGSCLWSSSTQYTLGSQVGGYYQQGEGEEEEGDQEQQQEEESWPRSCTRSNTYDKDGNFLYYHIKPLNDAKVTVGLYTESSCRNDYTGNTAVETVLTQAYVEYEGNNNDYQEEEEYAADYQEEEEEQEEYVADYEEEEQAEEEANDYADNAYDVEEEEEDDDDGNNNWNNYWENAYNYYMNNNGNRRLEDAGQAEEGESGESEEEEVNPVYDMYQAIDVWNSALDEFKVCRPCQAWSVESKYSCKDSTGAIGVNQCMLFARNTNMYAADFQDVYLASVQGSIVSFTMDGVRFGHGGFSSGPSVASVVFFALSLVLLLAGYVMYRKTKKEAADAADSAAMQEPLVTTTQGVVA